MCQNYEPMGAFDFPLIIGWNFEHMWGFTAVDSDNIFSLGRTIAFIICRGDQGTPDDSAEVFYIFYENGGGETEQTEDKKEADVITGKNKDFYQGAAAQVYY